MILHEFPDIGWLQKQIQTNFSNRKDWNQNALSSSGWPTVLLQTKTTFTERKDIKGPFSLFMNKQGKSEVFCEGRKANIGNETYVCTNFDQHYDLFINEDSPTETFNIHFGEKLYSDTLHSISNTEDVLLDNINADKQELNFRLRPGFRDNRFNYLIQKVESTYLEEEREYHLYNLLSFLFYDNFNHLNNIQKIGCKKKSTKEELIYRVHLAIDFIHSNYSKAIDLDLLANAAMMSKFHFLRVFKALIGQSPHQYIQKIRLEKAIDLIHETDRPLYLIAQKVGMENGSSLSRMIYQKTGKRPFNLKLEK